MKTQNNETSLDDTDGEKEKEGGIVAMDGLERISDEEVKSGQRSARE